MPFLMYALITWTTRDRAPLITRRLADFLHPALRSIARQHGVELLETGIVNDHVHALVRLPARIDMPRLAQGLKGTTARIANRDGIAAQSRALHWASGYDVRSVGPGGLKEARQYLRDQHNRHPDRPLGV
jgi:REP element-mobilizing transposase RayT